MKQGQYIIGTRARKMHRGGLLSWCMWMVALMLLPLVTSCTESDNEVEEYPQWKATNEAYWQQLYSETQQKINAGDNTWKIIPKYSVVADEDLARDEYIIVHVIEEGKGAGCPLYTDTVSVNYSGRLLPSTSYSGGYQFDASYTGAYNPGTARPTSFAVSGVVDGFATALQKMHIGDRWEVYIPYSLGYGSSNESSSIPAYSTLIFDLALVSYWRPGAVVPTQK